MSLLDKFPDSILPVLKVLLALMITMATYVTPSPWVIPLLFVVSLLSAEIIISILAGQLYVQDYEEDDQVFRSVGEALQASPISDKDKQSEWVYTDCGLVVWSDATSYRGQSGWMYYDDYLFHGAHEDKHAAKPNCYCNPKWVWDLRALPVPPEDHL